MHQLQEQRPPLPVAEQAQQTPQESFCYPAAIMGARAKSTACSWAPLLLDLPINGRHARP